MKKHADFNRLSQIICYSVFIVLFSCEKPKDIQTFNDVFDTSGVEDLNAKISDPESIAALNYEFAKVNINIANALENITLDEILAHLNQSIKLSPMEIDMLLKNDSKTYIDVINRFGSFPTEMESLTADDFKSIKTSSLNKYLLKVKTEPENFYSNDYYSAVLEMQKFLQNQVIEPMDLLKGGVKTVPPGKKLPPPPPPVTILYYKIIALNNVWDQWWTYWSNGTRTKHKGASGSFPG